MIIDAKDLIAGRLATFAAKKALLGEKIDIVNAEKAVMTGKKEDVLKKFRERNERGNVFKGPFLPKMPDRLLRRMIRGMLPYKKEKGKKAFKRIMCYIEVPEKFKNEKFIVIKEAKVKSLKYLTLARISQQFGKKW